eukprot:CFRG6715T1
MTQDDIDVNSLAYKEDNYGSLHLQFSFPGKTAVDVHVLNARLPYNSKRKWSVDPFEMPDFRISLPVIDLNNIEYSGPLMVSSDFIAEHMYTKEQQLRMSSHGHSNPSEKQMHTENEYFGNIDMMDEIVGPVISLPSEEIKRDDGKDLNGNVNIDPVNTVGEVAENDTKRHTHVHKLSKSQPTVTLKQPLCDDVSENTLRSATMGSPHDKLLDSKQHLESSFWVCAFLDRIMDGIPASTCQSICKPVSATAPYVDNDTSACVSESVNSVKVDIKGPSLSSSIFRNYASEQESNKRYEYRPEWNSVIRVILGEQQQGDGAVESTALPSNNSNMNVTTAPIIDGHLLQRQVCGGALDKSTDVKGISGVGEVIARPMTESSYETLSRDALDLLWIHGIKLVVVLMRNSVAVGQVTIPVKNLTECKDIWFSLENVSKQQSLIAIRGRRINNRSSLASRLLTSAGGGYLKKDIAHYQHSCYEDEFMHMDDEILRSNRNNRETKRKSGLIGCTDLFRRKQNSLGEPGGNGAPEIVNSTWGRKMAGMRTVWTFVSLVELCSVLLLTTILLYTYARKELQVSASINAKELWLNIDQNLMSEFSFPQTATILSASYWNIPDLDMSDSSTVTNYLLSVYENMMFLNSVRVSTTFVASPENVFYGVGYELFYTHVPSTMDVLVKNSSDSDVYTYGVNRTCSALEVTSGCLVYNLSDPLAEPISDFNVTDRSWYMVVSDALYLRWSPIYTYATGVLGLTCSYRVPQDLDIPVKAVMGSDVSLQDLSVELSSYQYYRTGYSILFEIDNARLVATSLLDIPLTYERSCSSGNATVLDRERLYLSDDERLQEVGEYVLSLCDKTCDCYISLSEKSPVTATCPVPLSTGDTDCSMSPANETFGCQPLPSINPMCTYAKNVFEQGVPSLYTLPSGDILSVGIMQIADGEFVCAVVVPKADFTKYYDNILKLSITVSVAILIGSVILSACLINLITREFGMCTKQLARFAILDFSQPLVETERGGIYHLVKEIACIYEVMQSLRQSLRSFSKYVPPDVVRILIHSGLEATLGGQSKKCITVFFSDLVNFTSIAENLQIEDLNRVLGDYLQAMSSIIIQNKGTVDKYIGDAIMGIWNAPEIVVNHAACCCEAALLCQQALAALRKKWREGVASEIECLGEAKQMLNSIDTGNGYYIPPIYQRIGIHTGPAMVGNFGSADRLQYTAIGNTVNLGEYLEGLNKSPS